jgi:hypothetical protein
MFPHGRGPQGDVIRINNFVRLVRGGAVVKRSAPPKTKPAVARVKPEIPGMGPSQMHVPPAFAALDLNADGAIDTAELSKAAVSLKKLDKNADGRISGDEFRPPPPEGAFGPPPGGP